MNDTTIIGIIGVISSLIGILIAIIIYFLQKKRKSSMVNPIIQETKDQKGNNYQQRGNGPSTYQQAKIMNIYPAKNHNQSNIKEIIKEEVIFDGYIKIKHHNFYKINFFLKKGDIVKGSYYEIADYKIDVYILDGEQYSNFSNNSNFKKIKKYLDMKKGTFYIKVPYEDMWYIVFDGTYKQIDRKVKLKIDKIFKEIER